MEPLEDEEWPLSRRLRVAVDAPRHLLGRRAAVKAERFAGDLGHLVVDVAVADVAGFVERIYHRVPKTRSRYRVGLVVWQLIWLT